MTFGDTVDISGAGSMLDAALGAGISHIDTANGYAGGESERMLAKLLHGRRDSVTLATKAGMPHPDAGDNSPLSTEGGSEQASKEACADSTRTTSTCSISISRTEPSR